MSPSIKQINMRAYRGLHGESVIPKGCYCYGNMRDEGGKNKNGLPIFKVDVCPYWDKDEDREEQMNGYCWFLEEGDWENGGGGLLWDQCKYCGVNDSDERDGGGYE